MNKEIIITAIIGLSVILIGFILIPREPIFFIPKIILVLGIALVIQKRIKKIKNN